MKIFQFIKSLIKSFFKKEGFYFYVSKKGFKSGSLKIYEADNGKVYIMMNGRYTFLNGQQLEDLNLHKEDLEFMNTHKHKNVQSRKRLLLEHD